jgi:hypothetical protein
MKTTEGGRKWHQLIGFDKLLVGKCPFPALMGHHHERSIKHFPCSVLTTFTGTILIGVEKFGKM